MSPPPTSLPEHKRLSASLLLQDRAFNTPRVKVHLNTVIEDAFGNGVLQGLKIKNVKTGHVEDLGVNGLFYGIGHQPNSKLIAGQVELDEAGYVKVRQSHHAEGDGALFREVWRADRRHSALRAMGLCVGRQCSFLGSCGRLQRQVFWSWVARESWE